MTYKNLAKATEHIVLDTVIKKKRMTVEVERDSSSRTSEVVCSPKLK